MNSTLNLVLELHWLNIKYRRHKSPYTLSIPLQIQLCMIRGFQRLRGDMTYFTVTVAANFVIALALGSCYYNLAPIAETLNSKCILLYFAILFNALSSALEVGTRVQTTANPFTNRRTRRFSRFMLSAPSPRNTTAMPFTTLFLKRYRPLSATFRAKYCLQLPSTFLCTS